MTLTTEASSTGFKSTLDYEQQTWTLEGRVDKERLDDGNKHNLLLRLANQNSMLDVQLAGDCYTNAEGTTNAGMALKYLMSRDRQLKTLVGLRTEINRLRKEIKLNVSCCVVSFASERPWIVKK